MPGLYALFFTTQTDYIFSFVPREGLAVCPLNTVRREFSDIWVGFLPCL